MDTKGEQMKLDTLKDGDRIYVNCDEYIFHAITMIEDEDFMRCIKVENNVPMLIRVKE